VPFLMTLSKRITPPQTWGSGILGHSQKTAQGE
jgi:hypothetical protein